MAAISRADLCDAIKTTLEALTLDRPLDVRRKWAERVELDEQCARAAIIPGAVSRERQDLSQAIYDYTVVIVVQSRVSTGSGSEDERDKDETDVIDGIAEAIHNGLPESVSLDGYDLQLMESSLSEFDADDWQQRLLFTSAVTATYRQWASE